MKNFNIFDWLYKSKKILFKLHRINNECNKEKLRNQFSLKRPYTTDKNKETGSFIKFSYTPKAVFTWLLYASRSYSEQSSISKKQRIGNIKGSNFKTKKIWSFCCCSVQGIECINIWK